MKSSLTYLLTTSVNFAGSTFKINFDSLPLPLWFQPPPPLSCLDYCHSLQTCLCFHLQPSMVLSPYSGQIALNSKPDHVTSHLSSASVSPSHPGMTNPKSLLWMIRSFVIWPLVFAQKSLSLLFPLSTACHSGPWLYLPQNNHITLSRPLRVRSLLPRKFLQRQSCVASYTSS